VEDRLAAFQQGDLKIEILQDLDQRLLETRDLETVLDPPDEEHRVDSRADVLKEAADEA
jgi:hypothetical protein